VRTVQAILQQVYDAGDIYFGSYGGLYCTGCERFYTEKELVDGKCPDHKTVPSSSRRRTTSSGWASTRSACSRRSSAKPELIRPERYRNEVLAMLREPLEDLCISRRRAGSRGASRCRSTTAS
jgi:methionyl-tRNA synthetase